MQHKSQSYKTIIMKLERYYGEVGLYSPEVVNLDKSIINHIKKYIESSWKKENLRLYSDFITANNSRSQLYSSERLYLNDLAGKYDTKMNDMITPISKVPYKRFVDVKIPLLIKTENEYIETHFEHQTSIEIFKNSNKKEIRTKTNLMIYQWEEICIEPNSADRFLLERFFDRCLEDKRRLPRVLGNLDNERIRQLKIDGLFA